MQDTVKQVVQCGSVEILEEGIAWQAYGGGDVPPPVQNVEANYGL